MDPECAVFPQLAHATTGNLLWEFKSRTKYFCGSMHSYRKVDLVSRYYPSPEDYHLTTTIQNQNHRITE